MSENEATVALTFKANGAVQMSQSIKELNTVMNTASKEYKAQVTAMGQNATVTEKLAAEQKKLSTQFEAAQKRTQMFASQLKNMEDSGTASSAQLTKMRGILADAERAEASLGNQLEKVNSSLTDSGRSALDAKEKLNTLATENTKLKSQQTELTSAIKLENAQMDDNADSAQKMETSQKQLSSQINLAKEVVANLARQLYATKSAYGENSTEASQMATKLNGAKTAVAELETKLGTMGNESKQAGSDLEQMNNKLDANNLMEAGDALSGVGDKARGMAGSVLTAASEYTDGQTKMQASMGGTADQAQNLMGVVQNVMKNGIVGSVDEAVDAVSNVKTAFGDLDNTQLTNLTNEITTVSKRTGTDYNENIRSAASLTKAFGTTGEESMELIAKGFQNGANSSDDFLDTVNEYSPQFKDAGLNAKQMMNVIVAGAKDGAFNTDKAADAVKELGLKMTDSSTDVSQYFGQFSDHTQKMVTDLRNGKATSSDVTKSIAKDLKNMTPQEQKSALSALGTQFEDLGNKASVSLFGAIGSSKDLTGSLDTMGKQTSTEKLQGALENLKLSFAKLLKSMTPVIDGVSGIINALAQAPAPVKVLVGSFAGLVAGLTALAPAVISATGIFNALKPVFGVLAGEGGVGKLIGALGKLATPFTKVGGVAKLAFGGIRTAVMAAIPVFGSIISAVAPFIPAIVAVGVAIAAVILIFKNWDKIVETTKNLWNGFKDFCSNLWESIKQAFVKGVKAVGDFLNSNVGQMIMYLINPIAGSVNTIAQHWDKIKAKTSEIFGAIGSFISDKWNSIKDSISNAVGNILSSISNGFNNAKNSVSNVMRSMGSAISGAWNNIKNSISNVVSGIGSSISNGFNSAKNAASNIMNGLHSTVSGIVGKIKSVFNGMSLHFPSISIPHIPLPHLSISGGFSIKPPRVPSFGINWYAKGGVFTKPTLFGAEGGANGLGEAGPEAALPLNADVLGKIGKGIASTMGSNQPLILNIDGRTFASITGPYMSDYVSQKDGTSRFSYGRRAF